MRAPEETVSPVASHERRLLDAAIRELAGDEPVIDAGALARDAADASALVAALRDQVGDGAVISCLGLIEHLPDFSVAVEGLVALATDRGATVVLAVPNDADTPGAMSHAARTAWGEGAVSELRRLLPADHVALGVVALCGAALVQTGDDVDVGVTVAVPGSGTVPVAFVLAFGSRAAQIAPRATVAAADLRGEREHERARIAELEVLRAGARQSPGGNPGTANADPGAETAP